MEHACDGVTGLCALVQWSPPVAVCAVQENATYQCAVVVMADLASSTRFMDGRAHASFTDEHGTEASDLVVQRYKPLEWPIDRMLEFWFESPGVVSRDFQADLHVVPTVTLAEDLRPVEVTLDRTVTLTTSRHEGPF